MYRFVKVPEGERVSISQGKLSVPDMPIIPFIEGDGIGVDITPVMKKVVDAAVKFSYGSQKCIQWMEIFAGEKSHQMYGEGEWLPEETLQAMRDFSVGIKGPMTTPVGGGIRSLNVALRQELDLYVCMRPVRWFSGVPSPVVHPEKTDVVIFRENTEDIYAGVEWQANSPEAKKLLRFLDEEMGVKNIRFTENCGLGVKPISEEGSKRLIEKAVQYAIDEDCPSITLVHKGNIMKFTEGAFKEWGYALVQEKYGAVSLGDGWYSFKNPKTGRDIVVKDVIADAMLQSILLRPEQFSVVATTNLNGDYLSDALAAQVGGIGIAPGANMGDGVALFEATHGTAPRYAKLNKVNPSSLILSAEMMLRYLGWREPADLIIYGVEQAIKAKTVTYDFARLLKDENPTEVSCSDFGDEIIKHMRKS